ncbi:MAG: hypothetical protein VR70_03350 [Rhodospirillaceae bacterium BRH_c57]|nr:MAG: hypothetical protein VR70_03350 [Rhodospirillaceae bacterium BRH_c57]
MRHAHVKAVLPKLRRHAFILAGDRALADESVLQCLKACREQPDRVRPESVNIDLFRLFYDVAAPHSAPPPTQRPAGPGGRCNATIDRLLALPMGHRQVLALAAVEGFSVAQCADVLGMPPSRVGALLAQARQSFAAVHQTS